MRKMLPNLLIGLLLIGASLAAETTDNLNEARLLRFPDVSRDKIAFMHGGDIYIAPRAGGAATRLTSHEGLEFFPKFSPDGSKIAFGGQYDGDMSVYMIPVTGGTPKRLTYHPGITKTPERFGPENVVLGWTKDGKIFYHSRKDAMSWWEGRVYTVDTAGGISEPLPMPSAGFTSFSPDGKKVAYCPIYRDFRTWKRYKGGMAQDVWIFDLKSNDAKKITDWIGTDNMPMWYGDYIYFNSDRTDNPDKAGTLNIWRYDTKTGETRKITDFTEYDVRWPSLGTDAIAFENGGYIYLLDLPSEQVHKITIDLITDKHTVRPEIVRTSDRIADFDISPDGKRAVFSGRGDIFTVPAKEGNSRNLTNLSGSREFSASWSPDGKWIAFISDSSGEEEIYIISQDGKDKIRLTTDGHCRRYNLIWSPDSKKIAYSDKELNLFMIDIGTKKVTKIDKGNYSRVNNYSWSPDSKFIAYNKIADNGIWTIYIYSLSDAGIHQITSSNSHDYNPTFDPEGKYLYFLSDRNFNPMLGNYEFTAISNSVTNLYLIPLLAAEKSPFAPKSDEVAVIEEKPDKTTKSPAPKEDKKGAAEAKKTVEVKIDFEGIMNRQVAFELPGGNYGNLAAISGALFYTTGPSFGLNGKVGRDENVLHKYIIADKKDDEFASGIDGYALAANQEKMIISKRGDYFICGAGGPKAEFEDNRLGLSHMEMLVDHEAEYHQMFNEVWRWERDNFYDPNMHGVDWKKMHDKYEVLLPYVAHRFDFTYILGEMLGELACSHTYTGGGDMPQIPPSNTGLLGCDFAVDKATNRIKISRIIRGENWDEELRSPLLDPGLDVKEGDYLLAIDGREVTAAIDPYSLTGNTVGKTVTLTVNSRPTKEGAREIIARPIPSEENLRYYDWVESNRRYVDSVTNGKVGYIQIPDMDSFGLTRFMKMFYGQLRKDGLIIDVRYNGGGFVSHLILQRLREEITSMGVGRETLPEPEGINAYMIALQNQYSCSDGDIFPYFFRFYELGPLMGTRTWGGVVGIGGLPPMLDGGYFTIPGGTFYNLKGNWEIENIGVYPDIEVENTAARIIAGHDDQLEQAIAYLMKQIRENPRILPPRPAPPTPR
jgi:tricorn protease